MDLHALVPVPAPVDEAVVEAEIADYLGSRLNQTVGGPGGGLVREPWRIANMGAADWVMRRLADVRALAQEYRDQIALWEDAARRTDLVGAWFETRLKEWAIESRTKDRKSFPLAHGTVTTRQTPAAIKVDDDEKAIEWAKVHCPDAVKVEESLRISVAKPMLTIGSFIVGFRATNQETGESERIDVDPVPYTDQAVDDVRELMPGFVVEAIEEARVVSVADGTIVPGFYIEAGHVTASVSPVLP